ncbi:MULTISPECIES: hypothetical protein [Carboxydocella]|nr:MULTISPECIES: hypothetical protein [Carboxydocella]
MREHRGFGGCPPVRGPGRKDGTKPGSDARAKTRTGARILA